MGRVCENTSHSRPVHFLPSHNKSRHDCGTVPVHSWTISGAAQRTSFEKAHPAHRLQNRGSRDPRSGRVFGVEDVQPSSASETFPVSRLREAEVVGEVGEIRAGAKDLPKAASNPLRTPAVAQSERS